MILRKLLDLDIGLAVVGSPRVGAGLAAIAGHIAGAFLHVRQAAGIGVERQLRPAHSISSPRVTRSNTGIKPAHRARVSGRRNQLDRMAKDSCEALEARGIDSLIGYFN